MTDQEKLEEEIESIQQTIEVLESDKDYIDEKINKYLGQIIDLQQKINKLNNIPT